MTGAWYSRSVPAAQRPRDAQRARVYRAETPLPSSPLVGTLWWQARFPDLTLDRVPRLRPGNGARQAFLRDEDDGSHTITLPRRYRTKGVVLHELAHWAMRSQPDLPDHGRTFTRLLLDATEEFCGPERASLLAASFSEHRVRVGQLPQPTLDGRLGYGDDERRYLEQQRERRRDNRAAT